IDRELWAALAAAGLLGISVPEECGGSGLGIVELCILLEEVGRAVAPVPVYSTLVLGALPVAEFGSPAQRRRLLPGVAGGALMLSGALCSPRHPETLAPSTPPTGGGEAPRRGGVAGGVAGRGGRAGAGWACRQWGVGAVGGVATVEGDRARFFIVAPRAAGVTLERQEMTHREVHFLVTLDGARGDRLGGGSDALVWLVRRATVGLCAMQVGVTERALRMTAEYTSTREQFGRPLSAFQAVSQRAADAYVDVEAIRLTTLAAVWRLAQAMDADQSIAVAKFWAAEAGQRVVHAAQHLHGGVGVDVSYPLHRSFLWAKQLELSLGGATEQLLRLGTMIAEGVLPSPAGK